MPSNAETIRAALHDLNAYVLEPQLHDAITAALAALEQMERDTARLRDAITEYRHWFDTCTRTGAENWEGFAAAAIDRLDAAMGDAAPAPADYQPTGEELAELKRLAASAINKCHVATEFQGDPNQFWTFSMECGGRVRIPPDQVRRMWNDEQIRKHAVRDAAPGSDTAAGDTDE